MMRLALTISLLCTGLAQAQQVAPFTASDCTPGYTAEGTFVDVEGRVFAQTGWRVTEGNVVVNAEGRRIFLSEACLTAAESEAPGGLGSAGIGALLGVVVLVGLAGGGSTNGTN